MEFGESLGSSLRGVLRFAALLVGILLVLKSYNGIVYDINKVLIAISLFQVILQIFCSFFPEIGRTILTNNAFVLERYGRSRLTVLWSMTPLLIHGVSFFWVKVTDYSVRLKKKVPSLLCLAIYLYYILFVTMSRKMFISLAIVFIASIIISSSPKRLLHVLVVAILGGLLMNFLLDGILITEFNNIFSSMSEEASGSSGNIGIRLSGMKYYFDYFLKSDLLGIGFTPGSSKNEIMYGFLTYGYNVSDQGTIGMVFMFGIPSLVISFLIFHRVFKDLYNILAKSGERARIIAKTLIIAFVYRIVAITHLFYWHQEAIWWGIFLFMVYQLVEEHKIIEQKIGDYETTRIDY
jgi:hypothetical protein